MKNSYRNLTSPEINCLERNHCVCKDWSKVLVKPQFNPEYFQRVEFIGDIKLGVYENFIAIDNDIQKHAGIYDACLHNVEIGDNCLINRVTNYISNYVIGNNCRVNNVESIVASQNAVYGSNVKVAVLDESGGRAVRIFDKMSVHVAYFQTAYRYDRKLMEALDKLIDEYNGRTLPPKGVIGNNVQIQDAGLIKDVVIRDYAVIEGTSRLTNGTIVSEKVSPTYFGWNVIAEDFIAMEGACVEDGVYLNNCFVGQTAHLKRGYSATDSLFFSNCHMENGESCATFAGPFTVSHHKPTLLIGGMFSFMNAGSGTNQSNHLYKLGPIHQGVAERGLKTSSNNYIMWPAHIGAFTFVMGKHYSHPDSSEFPFSYLNESPEKSLLLPGVGLINVNLLRDGIKWRDRDKRTSSHRYDYIVPDIFSPYTMGKSLKSIQILKEILKHSFSEMYEYKGCQVKNSSIQKGIGFYEMSVSKYLGDVFFRYLDVNSINTFDQIDKLFANDPQQGISDWVDISGLLAPQSEIDGLISKINSGEISMIEEIDRLLGEMYMKYPQNEYKWVIETVRRMFFKNQKPTFVKFVQFIDKWHASSKSIFEFMLKDIHKEFAEEMTTGFGLDHPEHKQEDIMAVRGFMKQIR